MDIVNGTVEHDIVSAALNGGVTFVSNRNLGYIAPLSRVKFCVFPFVRAAIERGIFPDELKGKSVVFAEIENEAKLADIQRKKEEVEKLKMELGELG